jgi:hypothetical protein
MLLTNWNLSERSSLKVERVLSNDEIPVDDCSILYTAQV